MPCTDFYKIHLVNGLPFFFFSLHIYTWLNALWRICSLRLALQHCCNTHHKQAVWSLPQELQSLSFFAVMSSDHHHLFVLFFTLIYSLWRISLVPVHSHCWDWLLLNFRCIFVKQRKVASVSPRQYMIHWLTDTLTGYQ